MSLRGVFRAFSVLSLYLLLSCQAFCGRSDQASEFKDPDSCYFILSVLSRLDPKTELDAEAKELLRQKLFVLSSYYCSYESAESIAGVGQVFPPSFDRCTRCNGTGQIQTDWRQMDLHPDKKACEICRGQGCMESMLLPAWPTRGAYLCNAPGPETPWLPTRISMRVSVVLKPNVMLAKECLLLAEAESKRPGSEPRRTLSLYSMAFDFGSTVDGQEESLSDLYVKIANDECAKGNFIVACDWLGKAKPPADPEKRKAFDVFFAKAVAWANEERERAAKAAAARAVASAIDAQTQAINAQTQAIQQADNETNDELRRMKDALESLERQIRNGSFNGNGNGR